MQSTDHGSSTPEIDKYINLSIKISIYKLNYFYFFKINIFLYILQIRDALIRKNRSADLERSNKKNKIK